MKPLHTGARLACLFAACAVLGCAPKPGQLDHIRERGTLIVLTRNAPTTYYIGRDDKPEGPEYELVRAYARSIGVKPKFVIKNSVSELLHALADGKGDMIAAGLTQTPGRSEHFDFGPVYQQVRQQVVCRRGGPSPDSVADLADINLEVVADSSYVARLEALRKDHPKLHWQVNKSDGTELLLREVWRGQLDCTVADSDIVAINRRYFPNLVVAFDLTQPQSLAWVLPDGSKKLRASMQAWLKGYRKRGVLKHLMTRYYAHAQVFDYVDTRAYVRKIQKVYPRYQELFDTAADTYNVPPLILAAQSYQESHWNPHAISPTGVRGMMMLTQNTAASLGVKNRLNPAASIRGGAKYLAHMETRLSDAIAPEDRIWFALAAYNIGLAHVRDARKLAQRLGRDPNRWRDLNQVLPLLSKRRYYRTLAHGYARGLEPVRYVRRIRNYANILRFRTLHDEKEPTDTTTVASR
jgi:membrane-bound lytic murein transglycosylase F